MGKRIWLKELGGEQEILFVRRSLDIGHDGRCFSSVFVAPRNELHPPRTAEHCVWGKLAAGRLCNEDAVYSQLLDEEF